MALGDWETPRGDDQSLRGSLFSSAKLDALAAGTSTNSLFDDMGDSEDDDEDASDLDSSSSSSDVNGFSFVRRARLEHQRRLQQQRQRVMDGGGFFARVETPSHVRSSMSLDVLASSMNSTAGFSMSSLLLSSQYGLGASQTSFAPFFVRSTRHQRLRLDSHDTTASQEQPGSDHVEGEAAPPMSPIGWSELLLFATPTERALLLGGLLFAAINGAIVALSTLVVGRAFAALALLQGGTTDSIEDASETIKRAAFALVVLGVACWLSSSAAAASTARSTRRQLTRLRIALLRQLVTLGDATTLGYLEQTQHRQPGTGRGGDDADNQLLATEDAGKAIATSVVHGDAHSRALEWLLTHALGRSCCLLAQFVGGAAVAFATCWQLALVACLSIFPLLAVTLVWLELYDLRQQQQGQESSAGAGTPAEVATLKARAVAAEALSSVRTLVAFNAQRPAQCAYSRELTRAARASVAQSRPRAIVRGLETGAVWALLAVIVGYASSLSTDTERRVQSSLAVLVAALALLQLAPTLVGVAAAQHTAAPLFAILDADPELLDGLISPSDPVNPQRIPPDTASSGAVAFRDVHTVGGASPLRGVNLSAAPGERVAVVGAGCGAIAALLGRFGSPAMGQILLDGCDVKAIDRRWLRAQLAVAGPSSVLFAGSIFDNIAMGLDPDRVAQDASSGSTHWPPLHVQREVVKAATLASAHEFIMALPDQYATRVDQAIETSLSSLRSSVFDAGDKALTSSQRQLIALARTLIRYSTARVLVLDRVLAPLPSVADRASWTDRISGRKSSAVVERVTLEQAVARVLRRSMGTVTKAPTVLLLMSTPLTTSSALLDPANRLVDRVVHLKQGRSVDEGVNRGVIMSHPAHNRMQREVSVESNDSYSTDTSGDEIVSANDTDKESAGRGKRAATDGSVGVGAGDRELPWATLEHFEYSFHSDQAAAAAEQDKQQPALFQASAVSTRARQPSVLSSYNSRHRLRAATLLSALPPTPHSASQASSSAVEDDPSPTAPATTRSFSMWEALAFTRSERGALHLALVASALLGLATPLGCVLVGAWAAQLLVANSENAADPSSTVIWWAVGSCTAAAVTFALVQTTHAHCSTRVRETAGVKLQTLHFRALMAQPMSFFDARETNVEVLTAALASQGPTVATTLAGAAQSRLVGALSAGLGAVAAVVVVTTLASGGGSNFWWQFSVPALFGVLPLAVIGETLVVGAAALAQAAADGSQQQQQHTEAAKSRLSTPWQSTGDSALDHAAETLTHLRTVMALGIQRQRCDEFAIRVDKEEALAVQRSRSSVPASLLTSGGGAFLVRFAVIALLLFAGDNALAITDDTKEADKAGSASDARDSLCGVLATILVVIMTAQEFGQAIAWWQRHSQAASDAGAAIRELKDRAEAYTAAEREMNTVVAAPDRVEDLGASATSSFSSSLHMAVTKKRERARTVSIHRLPDRQRLRGAIAFRHVTFAYPTAQTGGFNLVLRNASTDIQPGETVALCGAPGSGKSTVLALLERFYDPQTALLTGSLSGDGASGVFFDGIDGRAIEAHWLRDQIGLMSLTEDAPLLLFRGSIMDNIALGVRVNDSADTSSASTRPSVSHGDVVAAAQAANAHGFISQLPDGYATRVDSLDESQALRVALARAIVRNPPVLLVDGVGAADLDELVSSALVNVIAKRRSSGKTTVLTTRTRLDLDGGRSSHQYSASPLGLDGVDVDKWLVVANGSIAELNLSDEHPQPEETRHGPQQQTESAAGSSHELAEQLIDRFWSDIDDIDDDDDDDDIEEAEPGPMYVPARLSRPSRVRITLPPELQSLTLPPSPSPSPLPLPPLSYSFSSSSQSPTSSMASSTASYQSLFSV